MSVLSVPCLNWVRKDDWGAREMVAWGIQWLTLSSQYQEIKTLH